MALQKQTMVIPIAGLDTHADPKSAVPGTLVQAENVWFKRTARGGELRKRFGVTARTKTTTPGPTTGSVGQRLASYRDQQLLFASTFLHSWSPATGAWRRLATNCAPSAIKAEAVSAQLASASRCDVAVGGGLLCFVHVVNSNAALVTVTDVVTGVPYQTGAVITSGTIGTTGIVRVVALASSFLILLATAGNAHLMAKTITYATPGTITAETQIHNVLGASANFDLIRNGSNDTALVAYHSTNANKLEVVLVNSNRTTGATVGNTDVPDKCISWLTWDMSDNLAYLLYCGAASGIKQLTITQTPTISATATVDAGVTTARHLTGYRLSGSNAVLWDVAGANTFDSVISIGAPGGGTGVFQRSCGIAAKVFMSPSSLPRIPVFYQSPVQNHYLVIDANPNVVSKAFFGEGQPSPPTGITPACAAIDANRTAIPVVRQVASAVAGSTQAYYLIHDETPNGVSGSPRQANETLHIPGASAKMFDGLFVTEMAFHVFPEQPYTITQAVGGSKTTTGVYQVSCVYALTDNRGQIHRSAPSVPIKVTLTGTNQQFSFNTSTLRIGELKSLLASTGAFATCTIEVYSTVSTGSTFFQETTIPNDPTVDFVSVTLAASDANLSANVLLYTTGGALPHVPAPPARYMETWRGRLFLAGTEFPTDLWVSDEFVPGEGVSFSDLNVIVMEQEGGAITALAEMDDRLVIFKRSAIYQLSGQGPAANGDGQFEQPARITTAVGSIGPAGVVKTPQGILFKGTRGFHLLPRGGGAPVRLRGVEAYESLTLTGAVVLDDQEQVRLTHAEGRTLVYHFGHLDEQGVGRWTTFTGQAAVDTIVWAGQWVYLAADGTVQVEVVNQFNDNGAAIHGLAQFAQISPADLFGRCRTYTVRYLVDILATFTLTSTLVETLYGAVATQVDSVAVTAANALPVFARPISGRAETVQPMLEETSTTEGFRLSALGLEVGVKGSGAKTTGGQSLS